MLWSTHSYSICPTLSVTASGPTTFCSPGSVNLTGNLSSGSGYSYVWSNGVSGQTILASAAATYRVTATGSGCTVTASMSVSVNSAGSITPYINVNNSGWTSTTGATLCPGGSIDFGPQPVGGTWVWTGPAGFHSYQRDTTIYNITTAQGGTYIATYTAGNGCSTTQNYTVTINTAPSAAVTSTAVCPGSTGTLTATGGGTYAWNNGTSGASITAGTGSYTVTVTGGNSCTAQATGVISAIATAAPTVNSPTICSGSAASLTASGGTSYVWSNGATGASISVSPATTTSYTVTATVGSCTAAATSTVTVNSGGTIVPYMNVNSSGWVSATTTTLCQGGSVDLGPQPYGTWVWTGPAGFHSYQRDTTITGIQVSQSGTYVGTFTNTNGCTATQNFTITVNAAPAATVNSPSICSGAVASLNASGGTGYAWSTGASASSISTSTGGTYRVTVTGANSCTALASSVVTVNANPTTTVNSPSVCSGTPATLTATGGSSYLWSRGDTTTSISTAVGGVYTVTATSAAGCTATASGTATVHATPVLTATTNTPVCLGNALTLSSAASGSTSYTYRWSGPNAYLSTTANNTINPVDTPNTGNYTISVTDNFGCTVSQVFAVYVNPNCADSTTVGVNGGNSSDAPCTQILRFDHYNDAIAAQSGGQNHTWILKNGNILSMNIKRTAGGFTSVTAPTWSGAAFGQSGYSGLSGKTVLYTNSGGYSKLSFSNIVMKDSLGRPISNFTLIGIDGESTDGAERDTLTSNGSTWFDYDTITPPGIGSVPSETGIGTGMLIWAGTGPVNARSRLVSTNNPSNFTFSTVAGGLQGFAMGISNPIQVPDTVIICSNSSFNATPTNLPTGTTYTWTTPVISPAGSLTGATAQATPVSVVRQTLVNTTNAIATAVYSVVPSNNCSGLGYKVTILVYPAPKATVTPNVPQCVGYAMTAVATPVVAGTYTYSWSGPLAFTGTGSSFTINPTVLGNGGTYTVVMTDNHSCTGSSSSNISVVRCINVSGIVFDDANGNGIIDGTDAGSSNGQTLYSVLADSNGKVVTTAAVAANGTFTMGGVLPNTGGYKMSVRTSNPTVGSGTTAYQWPSRWTGTLGQMGLNNLAGTGIFSPASELVPVTVATTDITNLLIGYDRMPVSTAQTYFIPYPSRNSWRQLVPASSLGALAGADPEDGTMGTGKKFTITSLAGMNGNAIYYDLNANGVPDAAEQITTYTTITSFVPAKLLIKFTGTGSVSASFAYGSTDAAGYTDPTPVSYVINWAGALPVRLTYFQADKTHEGQALCSWATAQELDNDHFDIERAADAIHWQKIGMVKGAGTTAEMTQYAFTDPQPLPGMNYYRLKQVDVDGKFEYSAIAELDFGAELAAASSRLIIYPNPSAHAQAVNIVLDNPKDQISTISVTDAIGREVHSASAASHEYILPLTDLPAGVYLVTVLSQSPCTTHEPHSGRVGGRLA